MKIAEALGLVRSLVIYYGQPWRRRALARFYAELVPADALVFDVGAHVGSRTRTLLSLGARAVAIEPQPVFAAFLDRLFRDDPRVTLVSDALGAAPGVAELRVSSRHPTVSSLSGEWVDRIGDTAGFERVDWDAIVSVPVTTLDALIARHGVPDFCKLDVEGLECEILAGVSQPLPLVALEYLPAALDVAYACMDRLESLGRYEYNLVPGETHAFLLGEWCDASTARTWLELTAKPGSDSGDLYARLPTQNSAGAAPASDRSP